MGLLKKLNKKKTTPMTVGKILKPIDLIDQLKQNKLLQTTDMGVFYTYPEVLKINKDPSNFLKQLYVYARTTKLLQKGEPLEIREPDQDQLMATITGDTVKLYEIQEPKAEI